jgi:uncharacterized protein
MISHSASGTSGAAMAAGTQKRRFRYALLFGVVLAPTAVVLEFGDPPVWLSAAPVPDPTLAVALGLLLGAGEAEAMALAAQRRCRVILDDHQARSAATRIGVEVIGTVGVLLLAKRNGLIPVVGPLLDALRGGVPSRRAPPSPGSRASE